MIEASVEMRICSSCGESKPLLTEFYKSPRNTGGRERRCRTCRLVAWRAMRHKKPKKYNEAKYKYYERHPERMDAKREGYEQRYPEKKKAGRLLRAAVKAGRIVRPSACAKCGKVGKVQGHHADYSKPYDVEWLCVPCHIETHWPSPVLLHPEEEGK